MTTTPPQEQTEREALLKLARFGAAMLRAHRGISPGEIGDIDGFTAQDEAVKCGVLETRTVTAPCGPSCECVGLFPTECHFVPDAVGRLRRSFEASDKAKGPGEQHRGPEAGQEPPTHEGSVAALQREVEELRAAARLNTSSAPSIDDARRMGATGGAASEAERLAFEAWMAGHCWALSAAWTGSQYLGSSEGSGNLCPHAVRTRQLWAAWRDRAALASKAEVPNG